VAGGTERKRREANLALLIEVSHRLAGLTDIEETMDALGERIAEHFGASFCAFPAMDEAAGTITVERGWFRDDVPRVMGVFRTENYHTEEFRRASRAGEIYVVRDAANDARMNAESMAAIQVGAMVNVPLVRDGE
jgi:GAF domain-containing protein